MWVGNDKPSWGVDWPVKVHRGFLLADEWVWKRVYLATNTRVQNKWSSLYRRVLHTSLHWRIWCNCENDMFGFAISIRNDWSLKADSHVLYKLMDQNFTTLAETSYCFILQNNCQEWVLSQYKYHKACRNGLPDVTPVAWRCHETCQYNIGNVRNCRTEPAPDRARSMVPKVTLFPRSTLWDVCKDVF